jgi:hypothetical protein
MPYSSSFKGEKKKEKVFMMKVRLLWLVGPYEENVLYVPQKHR